MYDYGLCIAEDDGEVDWAFPCLDANEPCSKFGFTCLGLVDLKSKHALIHPPLTDEGGIAIFSGAFQGFPKAVDSGHSNQNTSRHNTGGSATSEAVISALKAVNAGIIQFRPVLCSCTVDCLNWFILESMLYIYKIIVIKIKQFL